MTSLAVRSFLAAISWLLALLLLPHRKHGPRHHVELRALPNLSVYASLDRVGSRLLKLQRQIPSDLRPLVLPGRMICRPAHFELAFNLGD